MKKRIAVLFHEKQRGQPPGYHVHTYAEFWREDGNEVIFLYGTGEFLPADLILVHVDLSIVPDEYLEFAKRYPIAVNGEIKDIRKSSYSQLLVKPGDGYHDKVIVKSNYNYAGIPEKALGIPLDPRGVSSSYFWSPLDYQTYENPAAVPGSLYDDPNIVVEKFQPEIEDGLYWTRSMLFVGDRVSCSRMGGPEPIVNGSTRTRAELVEPHPEILAMKDELKFGYGKFDYVIHEGCALLLDTNKTVGAPPSSTDPKILAARRYRAEGIYSFFRQDA